MVFKRKGGKSQYFQARLRGNRRKQLSTGTPRKMLADRIAAMWETLAVDHRAWDLLDPVVATPPTRTIGDLYDAFEAAKGDVAAVRRAFADIDLEPLVAQWLAIYTQRYPKNAGHAEPRVRALLPAGQRLPRSRVTRQFLTEQLYAYRVHGRAPSAATRRRVAASWSVFFEYLTDVRGLFEANPMDRVELPPEKLPPVQFHDEPTAQRIVAGGATVELRGAFALAYGGAIEKGVLQQLRRQHVDVERQQVRAIGTKTDTGHRDRVCAIAEWAWPYVAELVRGKLPGAYLLPDEYREHDRLLTDQHKATQQALGVTPIYKLHNARHHWAATRLQERWAIEHVQKQLGHSTPVITFLRYGRFQAGADERSALEREAATKRATKLAASKRQKGNA